MLFLHVELGDDTYIIDTDKIIEVIPHAELRNEPHLPQYFSGLMNYRSNSIPVIDMSYLLFKRYCESKLSTRIIVTRYEYGGQATVVGLLCEGVTETVKYNDSEFTDAGVHNPTAPYLGSVIMTKTEMIQEILINDLLSSEVDKGYFPFTADN